LKVNGTGIAYKQRRAPLFVEPSRNPVGLFVHYR